MNTLYVIVPKNIFLEFKDDELDSYISNVISRYNKNKISSVEVPYSSLHEIYTNITMGDYDYADTSNLSFEKFLEKYKIPECSYFIDDEMELFNEFKVSEKNNDFSYTQSYFESIFSLLKSKRKYTLGKNVMTVNDFINLIPNIKPNPIVIDHTKSIFHMYFGYRGDYIFDSHEKYTNYAQNFLQNYHEDFIVSLDVN